MGLDMYLSKKTYVKHWDHNGDDNFKITIKKRGGHMIKPKRITYIEEEVAYWRKSNQIHHWFVNNVQNGNDDCGDYFVSGDYLRELLNLCKEVEKDPSAAQEILPTQGGFFFGDTSYDEYYMQDIKQTIKVLEEILEEDPDAHYVYSSSW